MTPYTNILITGGSGFMGSNFTRYLYSTYPSYRIFNLDKLTYAGNPENLRDIEEIEAGKSNHDRRYVFIKGDICDISLLHDVFSRNHFDLVVHFAAETHVDRSMSDVADFIRTNIEGTRCVLEAARLYKVGRLVHISTDEVYGTIMEGEANEYAPLSPANLYSASKAGGDLLVPSYMKIYQTPTVLIRSSNNFGPYQYPEKLIPLAISNLLEDKKIPIHGSGEHIRSWLHVEDFCRAIDVIAHKADDRTIYNISGDSRTNLEVIKLIANYLGKDPDRYREHTGDRPNADFRYAPDSTKLQRELGWRRRHTVESSIGEVIKWYASNRPWWQKIKDTSEFQAYYQRQATAQW